MGLEQAVKKLAKVAVAATGGAGVGYIVGSASYSKPSK